MAHAAEAGNSSFNRWLKHTLGLFLPLCESDPRGLHEGRSQDQCRYPGATVLRFPSH